MDKKTQIIIDYLNGADSVQRHKYALGFSYADDLHGIEFLANDLNTDTSTALTILFNLLPVEKYDPDANVKLAIVDVIKGNVASDLYINNAISFNLDNDSHLKEIAQQYDLSEAFYNPRTGNDVGFPINYFEGLPWEINEEIKAIKKSRKRLP